MTEQSQELLPCPWCGGEAMIFRKTEACCKNEKCAGWTVNRCGIDKWNTRPKASPTLADASLTLQLAILTALSAVPEEGWCVGLRGLSGRTGLSREVCRAIVADLRAAGLASYHKGLWSDDDMPAGAGYAITSAGLAMLASATGENTC